MYCAVLNQILMRGLRRTNVSTTIAVDPAITIGHGWPKSTTDARKGMNPTEVLTLAKGILKKNESLTMPSRANAAKPFQKREGNGPGSCHSPSISKPPDASETAHTNA